jgi:pimeloyl-ACP methyl ester carboxylesterase
VANAATWIPLGRELGADAELIAHDLPGHGDRRDEPFVLAAAIAELAALVATESARRPVIVVGDSLGGYLALAVAARAGAGLAGVVAGGCTFPMRGVFGMLARVTLLGDALIPAAALAAVLRRACAPDVAAAIEARGLAPAMRGATLRALLGRDVPADVAAIRVPLVFINGALDVPLVWCAGWFARRAVRGRSIVVPRAPHGVGLTQPAAFAAAIRALLPAP